MRRFALGVPTALLLCSVLLVGCPKPNIGVTPGVLAFEPDGAAQELTITNTSRGRLELEVEVTTNAPWLTVDDATSVTFTLKKEDAPRVLNVAVAYEEATPEVKAAFATGAISVVATAAEYDPVTEAVTVTTGNPQYWTQSYDPALEGKMVIFSQEDTPKFYKAEIADVAAFGPDMRVDLSALDPVDFVTDPVFVDLTESGKTVSLYGESYTGVYVSSDGRVAFEAATPVTAESDLFAEHFAVAGVSGLLAAGDGGDVYAVELDDRLLIVKDGGEVSDSFQVELFFDAEEEPPAKAGMPGTIAIAWFSVDEMIDAVVGLSEGGYEAVPDDFFETGEFATDLVNMAVVTDNTLPLEAAKDF